MNVFVGCYSKDTKNQLYNDVAEKLGNFIVNGKHNLVFGGCRTGLMGRVYNVVSKSDESKVVVSMLRLYKDQLKDITYQRLYFLKTVAERKTSLMHSADIIIFLPGGIGTFDELFSSIESKRSYEHKSPIIIINVNHFFDKFLEVMDEIYKEGFADEKNKKLYTVVDSVDEIVKFLV